MCSTYLTILNELYLNMWKYRWTLNNYNFETKKQIPPSQSPFSLSFIAVQYFEYFSFQILLPIFIPIFKKKNQNFILTLFAFASIPVPVLEILQSNI